MRNARFLKAFGFLIVLLSLTACSGDDIYRGDHGGSNSGSYGNSNGYGNYGGYNGYNNGSYYPYGNANYPRDRIYVVNGYNPCNGYVYQGYCYRDKDDYRNAVIWDQNHRNDANWNKKRKDWCKAHDCSRDHDTHGRDDVVFDAQGKPILPPHIERDSAARAPRSSSGKPSNSGVSDGDHHQRQDRYENKQPVRVEQYPVEYRRPEQSQQPAVQREYHPQRWEQPVQQQRQPSGGNVQQSSPPERQQAYERPPQEQQKPQRGRAAKIGDMSTTPE